MDLTSRSHKQIQSPLGVVYLAEKPERTAAQGCGIQIKYRRLDLRIFYAFRLHAQQSRRSLVRRMAHDTVASGTDWLALHAPQ